MKRLGQVLPDALTKCAVEQQCGPALLMRRWPLSEGHLESRRSIKIDAAGGRSLSLICRAFLLRNQSIRLITLAREKPGAWPG